MLAASMANSKHAALGSAISRALKAASVHARATIFAPLTGERASWYSI